MGKVYRFMGLKVGLIIHEKSNDERREAYAADITYGTNNEMGFDYLRDNMVPYKELKVQRGHSFAIVDEVDSILIDEARTPLIISGRGDRSTDLYKQANSFARTLNFERIKELRSSSRLENTADQVSENCDVIVDEKARTAVLTQKGIAKAEKYFNLDNLMDPANMTIQHHINQAIKAIGVMRRDVDYVVKDGQVLIVDEFTGRIMLGRRYNEGLHQAIEAKEGVNVEHESKTLATITFQNYFRLYDKLSGMTGTAMTESEEFQEIYSLDVVEIPTNKPMIRKDMDDLVYKTEPAKFNAVIDDIVERHENGQPVLVGTISIEKSEILSKLLKKRGIKHEVLNAKYHDKEAEIVAQAGKLGAVTIATNMAGRGTDIMLGGNAEFLAKSEMRRKGYSEEVDHLRDVQENGASCMLEIEAKEKEKTGIRNLRVGYNRVFGYYIEVAKGQLNLVPDSYIRKQTLSTGERYITEELKELESTILTAKDRIVALEYDLFVALRQFVAGESARVKQTAQAVAQLDVLCSFAAVAVHNHYCKPEVDLGNTVSITAGRHPVVEQMLKNALFVPNDTLLGSEDCRTAIITGPNMAGKSTYMRQVALIVLMASIGSFVPASHADISICDRIFTRVGASDDLASGQSTFMVEMNEVANILRNATSKSLLILDEIGRGTSTFDGLAIAWAVIEHISNTKLCGAKTLFATHYHELTELEGKIPGVNNYCIAVKEKGDDIVFLRKIVQGGADKSYGIQVAKLAGVPDSVIQRAKELVEELSDADITAAVKDLTSAKKKKPVYDQMDMAQMSLFDTVKDNDIIDEIKGLDMGNMTPIEAMNTLYNLQNKIKNRW